MNNVSKSLFALMIFSILFYSCDKEETEIKETSEFFDQIISINSTTLGYYNSNNDRFEEIEFHARKKFFRFKLIVEKGKFYRIWMHGHSQTNIRMELFDEQLKTSLDVGRQADVGHWADYIEYKSHYDESLVLEVEALDPSVYDIPYFITFEEIHPYTINWNGNDLECSGDWKINANNELEHTGFNSGIFRYVRVKAPITPPFNIRADVFGNTFNDEMFLGFEVKADSSINFQNLATKGVISFSNTSKSEKWHYNTNGGSGQIIISL